MASICYVCGKRFSCIKSMLFHVKKFHKEIAISLNKRERQICCPLCQEYEVTMKNYVNHVSTKHGIPLNCTQLIFSTIPEFDSWVKEEQEKYKCKFRRRNTYDNKVLMVCHRSGTFVSRVPELKRKRILKKDSVKIGCMCTAHIVRTEVNGIYNVNYYSTHFPHQYEGSSIENEVISSTGSLGIDIPTDTLNDLIIMPSNLGFNDLLPGTPNVEYNGNGVKNPPKAMQLPQLLPKPILQEQKNGCNNTKLLKEDIKFELKKISDVIENKNIDYMALERAYSFLNSARKSLEFENPKTIRQKPKEVNIAPAPLTMQNETISNYKIVIESEHNIPAISKTQRRMTKFQLVKLVNRQGREITSTPILLKNKLPC